MIGDNIELRALEALWLSPGDWWILDLDYGTDQRIRLKEFRTVPIPYHCHVLRVQFSGYVE